MKQTDKNKFLRWLESQESRYDSIGWLARTVSNDLHSLQEMQPYAGAAALRRYAQRLPAGHLKRIVQQAIAEWVKTAAEPQVGIFWIIENDVVEFSEPVSNISPVQQFKDSPYDHMQTWQYIQKAFPEFKYKEYTQVPRGRVVMTGDNFVIRLPPDMTGNQKIISQVMKVFSLPRDRTTVEADEHYVTESVSDMDIDPFDEDFDPDEHGISLEEENI
jgi:hypothetical protein